MTYPNCYDEKLIRDFEEKSVIAFRKYALDWLHDCYLVDARLEFPRHVPWRVDNGDWIISNYPDGDYHFFLARDFSWGILGHPWEETMTIYGEELICYLLNDNPLMHTKSCYEVEGLASQQLSFCLLKWAG